MAESIIVAVVVAINSFNVIPAELSDFFGDTSRWCLLIAVSALGVRTSLQELTSVGPKPLVAMILQTILLAAFATLAILYFI